MTDRIKQMNKLKPCPFCGSERLFYARSFVGIYMVKCLECGAIVSFQGKEDKDAVCKAWNERKGTDDRPHKTND